MAILPLAAMSPEAQQKLNIKLARKLHRAKNDVKEYKLTKAEMLYKNGADINSVVDWSDVGNIRLSQEILSTQLQRVMFNSVAGFEWLLTKGADVNKKATPDSTPVLSGVIIMISLGVKEYSNLIKPILDARADTNVQDDKGYTPLMRAIDRGIWESAEVLLTYNGTMKQKIDFSLANNNGKTALALAKIEKESCIEGSKSHEKLNKIIALINESTDK